MTTITTVRENPPLPAAEVLTRARAAVARVDGLEAMLDAHPFSSAPEPSFRWMDREDGRQGVLL